ncbi:hypothetical protein SACC_06860 [Saccharolobus caldissimus]|uniref:Brix domain-containing protein n=1 Tax=Saccharolobus caldissimus TaxID=1702097 RepID=A0AAQ4CPD8_9CREN|nr:hypothetical protein SACC_06860 [Saccharolobus caldissimus]
MELSGQGLHILHTRVIITSSRDANIRVRNFLNVLSLIIRDSRKINRGKRNLKDIFGEAIRFNALYLIFISTYKGNPYKIVVYDLQTFSPKYIFKIDGLSLPSDYGISLKQIKNGIVCVNNNKCDFLRNFLIDMNIFTYKYNNFNCNIMLNINKISENKCELLFTKVEDNVKFFKMILETC